MSSLAPPARALDAVPNSGGTQAPALKAPANACDCHMHIYDGARFPPKRPGPQSRMQEEAAVAQYRLLQKRIGTTRTVIVTPAAYVTDNRVTLDAIAQLGKAGARGIAVVHPGVTDAELQTLADGGIRGIRFTIFDPRSAAVSVEMIAPLSKRIADLGWHIQIHMRADQIVENAALLESLPAPVVFDHLGRLPQPAPLEHAAFVVIRRMLDKGRTWVKLSGAYMDTNVGAPAYADKTAVAQAYIKAAPERVVWGSDWPHPTEKPEHKPDDAALFDLLAEWAPDEAQRRRILVTNPEALYGFAKTTA
ncbi:MAG: 2-pyrone-4,6-dicarboxylate hydrolase [Alphaproteobacteria bacterium]|nr:MAG: 2-pyrone-4,6-dicarboxylate hydrolase [Alphaproteobacteria bacterium]